MNIIARMIRKGKLMKNNSDYRKGKIDSEVYDQMYNEIFANSGIDRTVFDYMRSKQRQP